MEHEIKIQKASQKNPNDIVEVAKGNLNDVKEIANDDFNNEEKVKEHETKLESKKTFLKSAKFKKARLRAIEANNKLYARKQRNKLAKANRPPRISQAR